MALRDALLLVLVIGSLPICFIRPFYGIIVWAIVAFVNPQSFLWNPTFPLALAVAIATMAGFLLFGFTLRGLKSREVMLVLILWAWFAITSIVSTSTALFSHHAQETWFQLTFVSKILLMTIVMIPIVNTFERLRILIITIVVSFGFFVVKAFPFVILTGGGFRVYGPEHSMIADNNEMGLALNMTLPIYFFLAQTEARPWMKRLFASLFIMTIPVIFSTYSRGALLGLVAVMGSLFTFVPLKQRLVLVPVVAMGMVIALIFAPASWRQRMDPTSEHAIDASAQARLNVWQYSRNLAADYPITGGGFGAFTPELFSRYGPPGQEARPPHSVYFQILAEHGYVGLVLYLTLIFSCIATARRLSRQAQARGDRIVHLYSRMFFPGLVGFLVSGAFLGRAYFDYVFFLVACLVCLQRIAADEWARCDQEIPQEPEGEELWTPDLNGKAFGESA